jgi:DNA-binding winged helix-turn-helix (wHTH) protein
VRSIARNARHAVAVLRRRLGHGAADAGYITTVAKAGYQMLA